MTDFRVDIRVRNNRILSKIDEIGRRPGQSLADDIGIPYLALNEYINVKCSPLDKEMNIKKTAQLMCDFFKCSLWDLFTQEHIDTLEENTSSVNVSADDIKQVISFAGLIAEKEAAHLLSDPYEYRRILEMEGFVGGSLDGLSPKMQDVIRKRFGLDGFNEMTLKAIAEEYECSVERIRSLEMDALRRLRLYHGRQKGNHSITKAAELDGYFEDLP